MLLCFHVKLNQLPLQKAPKVTVTEACTEKTSFVRAKRREKFGGHARACSRGERSKTNQKTNLRLLQRYQSLGGKKKSHRGH